MHNYNFAIFYVLYFTLVCIILFVLEVINKHVCVHFAC